MKRAVILTPLILILMTGCTLGDMLRLTPQGQRETAAIQAKVNEAYVLGENRAFQLAQGVDENIDKREFLKWRKIQTTIDAEIFSASNSTTYTTGRLSMILRARGVSENEALVVVEELNTVLSEAILLGSTLVGIEQRRIVQAYLEGFDVGLEIALPAGGK